MLSHLCLATPAYIAVSLEPTIFNDRQVDSLPLTVKVLQQATCCNLY